MRRRQFLKQAGLGAALLGAGGLLQVQDLLGRRCPFTGKPRPEAWVLARHWEMHDILSKGWRTNVFTGYSQPCVQHGWRLVERVPLDLQPGLRKCLPIPGSLIFDDELTYAWAEKESALGPVRVDYLQSDVLNVVRMDEFLLELNGEPFGTIGIFEQAPMPYQKKPDVLHTNWYCGARKGDYAFKIEYPKGFPKEAWQKASLAIWEKKNADKLVSAVSC